MTAEEAEEYEGGGTIHRPRRFNKKQKVHNVNANDVRRTFKLTGYDWRQHRRVARKVLKNLNVVEKTLTAMKRSDPTAAIDDNTIITWFDINEDLRKLCEQQVVKALPHLDRSEDHWAQRFLCQTVIRNRADRLRKLKKDANPPTASSCAPANSQTEAAEEARSSQTQSRTQQRKPSLQQKRPLVELKKASQIAADADAQYDVTQRLDDSPSSELCNLNRRSKQQLDAAKKVSDRQQRQSQYMAQLANSTVETVSTALLPIATAAATVATRARCQRSCVLGLY